MGGRSSLFISYHGEELALLLRNVVTLADCSKCVAALRAGTLYVAAMVGHCVGKRRSVLGTTKNLIYSDLV